MPLPVHGAFEDRSEKNMLQQVKNGLSVGKKKKKVRGTDTRSGGDKHTFLLCVSPGVLQCLHKKKTSPDA